MQLRIQAVKKFPVFRVNVSRQGVLFFLPSEPYNNAPSSDLLFRCTHKGLRRRNCIRLGVKRARLDRHENSRNRSKTGFQPVATGRRENPKREGKERLRKSSRSETPRERTNESAGTNARRRRAEPGVLTVNGATLRNCSRPDVAPKVHEGSMPIERFYIYCWKKCAAQRTTLYTRYVRLASQPLFLHNFRLTHEI